VRECIHRPVVEVVYTAESIKSRIDFIWKSSELFAYDLSIYTMRLLEDRDVGKEIDCAVNLTAREYRSCLVFEPYHEVPVAWIKRIHRFWCVTHESVEVTADTKQGVVRSKKEYISRRR